MAKQTVRINAMVSVSLNYHKVMLSVNDHPIEFDEDEPGGFGTEVKKVFSVLRKEVRDEYGVLLPVVREIKNGK